MVGRWNVRNVLLKWSLFRGELLVLRRVYHLYLAQKSPPRFFHTSNDLVWNPPKSFEILKYLIFPPSRLFPKNRQAPFFSVKTQKTEFFYNNIFWPRSDLIKLNKKTFSKQKNHMLYPPHINLWLILFLKIFRICERWPETHLLTSNGAPCLNWNPDGICFGRLLQWTLETFCSAKNSH